MTNQRPTTSAIVAQDTRRRIASAAIDQLGLEQRITDYLAVQRERCEGGCGDYAATVVKRERLACSIVDALVNAEVLAEGSAREGEE